jgi:hypothetical protein
MMEKDLKNMDGKITAMDEKMSLMQDSILAAIQELKA